MKTRLTTRKLTNIAALVTAAFFLVMPSVSNVFAACAFPTSCYNNFSYNNTGEMATVNVTNNANNAKFNITAAQYVHVVLNNSAFVNTGLGPWSFWTVNVTTAGGTTYMNNGTFNFFNATGVGGYWQTNATLTTIINRMHSTYTFTGIGRSDIINLTGGITADYFNINTPGNSTVFIWAGLGNSTYNLLLGTNSTISIASSNGTSTLNTYNVVF